MSTGINSFQLLKVLLDMTNTQKDTLRAIEMLRFHISPDDAALLKSVNVVADGLDKQIDAIATLLAAEKERMTDGR